MKRQQGVLKHVFDILTANSTSPGAKDCFFQLLNRGQLSHRNWLPQGTNATRMSFIQ